MMGLDDVKPMNIALEDFGVEIVVPRHKQDKVHASPITMYYWFGAEKDK